MALLLSMSQKPATALTIGGSDSGGAAGIQADLKTWTVLGVYGMSAITAVTAQNSAAVAAIQYLPPSLVVAQMNAVLSDYGAGIIKTGFLGQAALIQAIAESLIEAAAAPLVVDPVLVNHKGEAMFAPAAAAAYAQHLLPQALLATPNWREAALLAGLPAEALSEESGVLTAADQLHEQGAAHVLVTGWPAGTEIIDWWSDGHDLRPLAQERIATVNTHGSGDTLSAAICAYLCRGLSLPEAIRHGRAFTATALRAGAAWRLGAGHGPLAHFTSPEEAA